jgi:hypothetical protein
MAKLNQLNQRLHELEKKIGFDVLQAFENAEKRMMARLRNLEEELYRGYWGVRSGEILLEIRDDELFKEDGFGTYEEYLRQWGCSEDEANELIRKAEH